MKNKQYFAVVGFNGVAVMDSSARATHIQKYIKCAEAKVFDDFSTAEHWALVKFASFLPPELDVTNDLLVNRAVFRKHLRPDLL